MLIYKEKELSELTKTFLEGREDSFNEIAFLIHQDILNISYRYAGNIEDAKDILQEVLLKIYRKLKFFKKASKLSTWIYRVTINASLDSLRKRKSGFRIKSRYKEDFKEGISSRDEVDLKDKAHILKEALAVLPLKQKNVFILKHYQGLKIEKISNILGCSQSTVKTHLKRAIDNMRRNIGGRL